MERLGEDSGPKRRRLNHGSRVLKRWEGFRWPCTVNSTELSSSDWRAQQSQASDFSALSRAGGEIRDEGRAKLEATSD